MILSLLEYYGDVIFPGTSAGNINSIDRLFYRGLRICLNFNFYLPKDELCKECHISTLCDRRNLHLLLFMHRFKECENLFKKTKIRTRLHQAPVFWYYKPNNERVKLNAYYTGALAWNQLPAHERNMELKAFKNLKQKDNSRFMMLCISGIYIYLMIILELKPTRTSICLIWKSESMRECIRCSKICSLCIIS